MLNELIENEIKYVNDLGAIYALYLEVSALANVGLLVRWSMDSLCSFDIVLIRSVRVTKVRHRQLRQ